MVTQGKTEPKQMWTTVKEVHMAEDKAWKLIPIQQTQAALS